MRGISDNEKKKLVAIMETYGEAQLYKDHQGIECFSLEGYVTPRGNNWIYVAHENDIVSNEQHGISSIKRTYLALENIMLVMVETIQHEKQCII